MVQIFSSCLFEIQTTSSSVTHSTDTFYGIICTGLTGKTTFSFVSSNSSFSECLRRLTLSSSFYSSPSFSLSFNGDCDSSPYEECIFSHTLSRFSSSASFKFCTFDTLSVDGNGGAISFSQASSFLTVEDSLFIHCTSSQNGGAIYTDSASSLSVTSSTFIACLCPRYGGGAFVYDSCESSTVSFCTFLSCTGLFGGGLMTWMGPTSFLSSSRFISCSVTDAGGALYHNGVSSDFIRLTDTLFARNTADSCNHDPNDYGGGAFKDYRGQSYSSTYSFSFFSENIADTNFGHDIAISKNALSEGSLIHCFTTTAINAFTNVGDNETNWLPLGTLSYLNMSE